MSKLSGRDEADQEEAELAEYLADLTEGLSKEVLEFTGNFVQGFILGIIALVVTPVMVTAALALIGLLLYVIFKVTASLALVVVTAGTAAAALGSSLGEATWLVLAHLTVGLLVGAFVGLRAPKPRKGL